MNESIAYQMCHLASDTLAAADLLYEVFSGLWGAVYSLDVVTRIYHCILGATAIGEHLTISSLIVQLTDSQCNLSHGRANIYLQNLDFVYFTPLIHD